MGAESDRILVRRLLRGEEEAFEAFFERYFPKLFRFALVRLEHDLDEAEEVAQATLCKAVAKLSTYRGEAALFTWLCTFCRHEMYALHRRRNRFQMPRQLPEDTPEIGAALDSLAGLGGPEESLRRQELARLVQVTLDRLPARYGDALEWKYVEGLSVKEIARRLSIGPKAAESLLTRARHAFRDGYGTLLRGPHAPLLETD